ncbi:MAG: PhzF family phenazine biosynthesis protein [Kofleriaceae bacterium]
MPLPYVVVDAFTDRRFHGNPAAVFLLDAWLPDATLAAIARELALSESAFCVRHGDDHALRWFTPSVEVDLCGHATLATAFVLMHLAPDGPARVRFHTKSGPLDVTRTAAGATLDFPARVPVAVDDPALAAAVAGALGAPVRALWRSRNLVALVDDAAAVTALAPDFRKVGALPTEGLIVTAPGTGEVDFVSRYFTPQHGIDEDPVTGSAHCTLGPLWAARLGRHRLEARQLSRRGGAMTVEVDGDRVRMTGAAVAVARGELLFDPPQA